jgi:hypothetical protein
MAECAPWILLCAVKWEWRGAGWVEVPVDLSGEVAGGNVVITGGRDAAGRDLTYTDRDKGTGSGRQRPTPNTDAFQDAHLAHLA